MMIMIMKMVHGVPFMLIMIMKMVARHGAWCPFYNDQDHEDSAWYPFCASFFPERGQIPLEHDRWLERQTVSFIWSGSLMIIMKAIVMMMMMMMMLICICHLIFSYFFQGPVAVLQSLELNKCWFY